MDMMELAIEKARFLVFAEGLDRKQAANVAVDEMYTLEELTRIYTMFDICYDDIIQSISNQI